MNRSAVAAAAGAAAVTSALLLTACSSSGSSSGSASSGTSAATTTQAGTSQSAGSQSADSPATGGIVISGFAYSGQLTVKPGEKVTVTNKDSAPHTVTDKANHTFDSGTISGGGTGSFTAPTTPGTYKFGCTIHPSMAGTLVVR